MKVVIVGAGISGLSAAVLLRDAGHDVEVFECREHIGGLCHDEFTEGLLFQRYGPHIFHTSHRPTMEFVKRFATLYPFEHIVMARTKVGMFPIPFNENSKRIVGDLTTEQIREYVFKEYSEKHWNMPWEALPPEITSRVPAKRDSSDDRYTQDEWQGIPVGGYHKMFETMADGITIHLGVGKDDWRNQKRDLLVYTGRLDQYFKCSEGELEYRSARFVHRHEPQRNHPIINECMKEVAWTRSTDHSHWNGRMMSDRTLVTYEYPRDADADHEPLYPKPFGSSPILAERYRDMAEHESRVVFLGRMAQYAYLDMHVVIEKAIGWFG